MIRSVTSLLLVSVFVADKADAQTEPERVKAWLLAMPTGQVLQATLRSGEILDGTLAETQDHRFGLRVAADAAAKKPGRRTFKRWIEYQEVVGLSGEGIHVAASETALAPLVSIGDKVKLLTSAGEVVKGRIDNYDGSTLFIDDRKLSLAEGDVVRIDVRESDSF